MSKQLGKGLPSRNINTTAPLLSLMELKEAEELSLEWVQWLMHGLPRTEESGYQHVTTGASKDEVTLNDNEIWIDTLFMAILFTAKMGVKYDNSAWRQASLYQLLLHIKYLYDKKKGLFFMAGILAAGIISVKPSGAGAIAGLHSVCLNTWS